MTLAVLLRLDLEMDHSRATAVCQATLIQNVPGHRSVTYPSLMWIALVMIQN